MRKLLSLVLVVWVSGCVNAQSIKEKDVPAAATAAFRKMYPAVKESSWSMHNGNYEAEFDVNKMEQAATFDAKGDLLESEKGIAIKDLPAAIATYVSKNYGATIKEATEITDNKGVKTYEAEIKGKDLIFDASGKFLHEEAGD